MKKINLLSLASAALMVAPAVTTAQTKHRVLVKYTRKPTADTSAAINRWTGKPHEHKREIARNTRQAFRKAIRKAMVSAPVFAPVRLSDDFAQARYAK